jgi:GH15 family glucan-1,4-alpha-glucosidase
MTSVAISDYALIGDLQTAALVCRTGSIDWLCWPRFDSGACFAALLGGPEHGRWLVAPKANVIRTTRRYRAGTLILETDFETTEGVVTLIDFMPHRSAAADLVRIVVGRSGRVTMRSQLTLRFDYGAIVPWVTQTHGTPSELQAIAGPDMVTLRTPVVLRGEDQSTVAEFSVSVDERIPFVMTYCASHLPAPPAIDAAQSLLETEAFWTRWSDRCNYKGEWPDAVMRSLITLKALIYEPTGAIVAAPTTSLPEKLGGERNWDYRYCWLRDATFTLLALMDAGYFDEAGAWRDWLLRALAGNPAQSQIMYGIAGERRLAEWEVPWLPGYAASRPVRIGNAASAQRQLDVFGEVADAMYHARRGGLASTTAGWDVQRALTSHLETIWDEPDEGIWEVRGPRQHFTHSKVMAWVAVDRAIKAAEHHKLEAPVQRWRDLRGRIHADVCARGFDTSRGCFVQAYGSKQLDASLLLIPLVGFLPPSDARVRGTLDAIGKELTVDGLVLRYLTTSTDDGLPPGEGAFLACSFWYVDNLVLAGRHREAREMFCRLLELRNDVGLLAEEYDPRARQQLGNFPQAFSHVALIDSAYNLSLRKDAKPAEQRSTPED